MYTTGYALGSGRAGLGRDLGRLIAPSREASARHSPAPQVRLFAAHTRPMLSVQAPGTVPERLKGPDC